MKLFLTSSPIGIYRSEEPLDYKGFNPAYGMLMGYFTGKALYTGKQSYRTAAYALPFILHGLYDFSLADEFQAINDNYVFIPFIVVFIELIILIRVIFLIRKERHGAKYSEPLLQGEEK